MRLIARASLIAAQTERIVWDTDQKKTIDHSETLPQRIAEARTVHDRLQKIAERGAEELDADLYSMTSAVLLNAIGTLHSLSGEVEEARTAYWSAVATLPAYVDAYVNLGKLYLHDATSKVANAPIRAERVLLDALKVDPASARARRLLGELYEKQQRCAEAAETLVLSLEADPNVDAAARLGRVLLALPKGDPKRVELTPKALPHLRKWLPADSDVAGRDEIEKHLKELSPAL